MLDFIMIALTCAPQVNAQTLSAIVKTESNYNELAININGKEKLARQPENEAEAVSTARWLIQNGYSVDMGLSQINSKNLPGLGMTVDEVFDPCKNLAAAAQILQSNYVIARQTNDDKTATLQSLSAYNTGSFKKGFENGYVQKVISAVDPIPLLTGKNPQRLASKREKIKEDKISIPQSSVYFTGENEDSVNIYRNKAVDKMIY